MIVCGKQPQPIPACLPSCAESMLLRRGPLLLDFGERLLNKMRRKCASGPII